jgi:SAM-dependent methyltransferase
MPVDPYLLRRLVCPRHGLPLTEAGSYLHCAYGHRYPIVDDVPVLLDDGPQTLWVAERSLQRAQRKALDLPADPFYVDTLGISPDERDGLLDRLQGPAPWIDPVVSCLVGATNGISYRRLVGRLKDYPIPALRLPRSSGEVLLDVGCNWGRWCFAAARLGYSPIGIDPSLGAVLAAKRVAAQLGLAAQFVVGDARTLPFRAGSVDVTFSYSVLQHFGREDASRAIQEMGRVLRTDGTALVQMPTVCGLRCMYHQARRRFRQARAFDVRYWSIPALRRLFTRNIGAPAFSVDCYFGIGLQASAAHLLPANSRAAIRASEVLRTLSRFVPWLYYGADSVYVKSVRIADGITPDRYAADRVRACTETQPG